MGSVVAGLCSAGKKAKELIESARESLARLVGGRPEDIIFTSGGTEVRAPGSELPLSLCGEDREKGCCTSPGS